MLRYLSAMAGVLILAFGGTGGCTKKDKPTVWVYTSLYSYVVQDLNKDLARKFPDVNIKWYQSGSENISAKIQAELLAGKPQADLIVTSDVFLYEDLKARNMLLKYESPATRHLAPPFRDSEHAWATCRFSTMVLAYNSDVYSAAAAPRSFADLTQPRFKDKIAMGSPLESGTTFTTVAQLSKKLGWDYFAKLRANGAISAGGSSAVISKLETKERPVGIVLLENVLMARKKNPKLVPVYPAEGAIIVPGPVAITATTTYPELSRQIHDYFFSADAAAAIRTGMMHANTPGAQPPEGAESFEKILAGALPWTHEFIDAMRTGQNEVKQRFSKIMFE